MSGFKIACGGVEGIHTNNNQIKINEENQLKVTYNETTGVFRFELYNLSDKCKQLLDDGNLSIGISLGNQRDRGARHRNGDTWETRTRNNYHNGWLTPIKNRFTLNKLDDNCAVVEVEYSLIKFISNYNYWFAYLKGWHTYYKGVRIKSSILKSYFKYVLFDDKQERCVKSFKKENGIHQAKFKYNAYEGEFYFLGFIFN